MYKSLDMKMTTFALLSLSISFVIDGTLVVFLRIIRSLFPLPAIGSDKIIGYAQYFGYPLTFDTIFFFSLIAVPLLVLISLYLFQRNRK
jgi:hypothetical protein